MTTLIDARTSRYRCAFVEICAFICSIIRFRDNELCATRRDNARLFLEGSKPPP